MMVAMKHPHVGWVQGVTPQTVASYLDYMLGSHVLELEAKGSQGNTISKPAWPQIIA